MKWVVSVQFTRAKAYHTFFSLINLSKIKDTKMITYSHTHQIIEFETTTAPELDKLKKLGLAVQPKIVEVHE